MASPPPSQPHVVIFPFMSQGHTLPLLDLSKALSRRHLKVTIITTPSNAPSILEYISKHPDISLIEFPFPGIEGLPEGCENTSLLPSMEQTLPFLLATMKLQQPFQKLLQEMSETGSLPICIISDFFLGWTCTTCRSFGVPQLVFTGMGVLPTVIIKSFHVQASHRLATSDSEPLNLPGLKLPFTISRSDLPDSLRIIDKDNPLSRFVSELGQYDPDSWGVIVNSFVELEGEHVGTLESFYNNGAKAWCVGPLFLYDETETETETANGTHNNNQSCPFIKWLDERSGSDSVIYVAFGTQADVSDMQLDEVAFGLEMSGHPFVWVIRSRTWTPPDGLEERVKGRGLIVRDWVEQRRILSHSATSGFLSHCGWNSVLESLSTGVPLLAWPLMAEQQLNAKFVVEGLEAGLWVPSGSKSSGEKIVAVGRDEFCDGIRELMDGEKGRKAREKAKVLGRMATLAVQKGGSSYEGLSQLIERLI